MLGATTAAVLSEPLSAQSARAIGARRYLWAPIHAASDPPWEPDLDGFNRNLRTATSFAADAVCYASTGHNERRPVDDVLGQVMEALGFDLDEALLRVLTGQCNSMEERLSAIESITRVLTASDAYLDRCLPLDSSNDPVNLRERLGPEPTARQRCDPS